MRANRIFGAPILLVVQAAASPPAHAQTPVRVEALRTIGCVDCEGPQRFGGIADVAVADTRVYVLDNDAPHVRVFERDGRLARTFAGTGDGPGELRLPFAIAAHDDGSVDVVDARQMRVTRFDTAGVATRTRRLDGFPLAVAYSTGARALFILTTDFRSPTATLWRMADDDSAASRLGQLAADFPLGRDGTPSRFPMMGALPGGGFVLGDGTARYRIRWYDGDGKPGIEGSRDIPRGKKTAAEMADERARRDRATARLRARGGPERGGLRPPEVNEERDFFHAGALVVDAAGRLWVRTERGGARATAFDLFDGRGAFASTIEVRARTGSYAVDGDLLAAVTHDDDDVEHIGLWRIST